MKKLILLAIVIAVAAAAWHYWPKAEEAAPQGPPPAPEVSVVTMKNQAVVLTKDLPGRTSAVRVAEIRPQVSGIITKRLFKEGGMVSEGQQLYQIDPAPFQAAYNSAQADLQKAQANLQSVQARAARYAELVKIGGVSQQEYDDAKASLAQANADIAIARAAVETAGINLGYTKVMAPISGRIGQSRLTEGALVTANQGEALALVQQLDSVYVDVSQSSDDIMRLRAQYEKQADDENADAAVSLVVDGKVLVENGRLQFQDVTVNPETGTVLLRILFPNPDNAILPGLFVHARLEQWKEDNALLVPQQSVSRQADGSVSVWVVGQDGKVNPRPITVSEVVGSQWLVTGGLQAGEQVVVEGVMKIQPGMAVKAVEHGAKAAQPAAQEQTAEKPSEAPAE